MVCQCAARYARSYPYKLAALSIEPNNHAKQLLKTDGLLFFEIHENFALEVQQMLEGENFSEIKILDDFHEKARIVKAKINL